MWGRKNLMIGLFVVGGLLAALFAGCAGDDTAKTQSRPLNVQTDDDRVTIGRFNNLITDDFLEAFCDKYPEVNLGEIRYAGIDGSGYAMHSLQNGDIPDIYVTSEPFAQDAQEQYLLDLSNYDFVNHYTDAVLDSVDVNGSIYLLPSGYQLTGIYYNKTILEENGWEVPNSFEDLAALSEKIEAAGYQTMGHGMSLDGYPFNYFFNIGNTMFFGTPEGAAWKEEFPAGETKAVGNEELEKTAQYFSKWVEHGFITTEHTDVEQFYEGECVFYLCLGLYKFEHTAKNGEAYEFGILPWLSEDGSSNMLTRRVIRYLGIHKSLAEPGNEQKLEDALKLMQYISTVEGQESLMRGGGDYIMPLHEAQLSGESPYQEIAHLVEEGRTAPLLYVGWEHLVVPIAKDIKQMIQGEMDVDGLLKSFDDTAEGIVNGSSDNIFAVCEETLTMEQTAELIAVAQGKAVDADCAMISLNEYHKDGSGNNQGAAWHLYQGKVGADLVNLIRPRSETISVLEMTGAEIKAMQKEGVVIDSGEPYPYYLYTRGGVELIDDKNYKLAVSTNDMTENRRASAQETEISPFSAIEEYLRELGTVSAEAIGWE